MTFANANEQNLLYIHYIQNINVSSFPSMMKKHVPWFQIQSFFGEDPKQKKPMVKGWWLRGGGEGIPPSSGLRSKVIST